MKTLFTTPHTNIGIHDWRRIVATTLDGQTVSFFQFRLNAFELTQAFPPEKWKHQCEWPDYDHRERPYCGLPKRLIEISAQYKSEIRRHLILAPKLTNPAPA